MSTLSVTNLKNAASATNNLVLNPDGSVNISGGTLSPQTGFKNRLINGNMTIDQRNAGAAVNTDGAYPVDRWKQNMNGGGVISGQRSTVAPANFVNSLSQTVTTADTSIAAADYYYLNQNIEGFNVADLGWGTASAQSITISFQVRSSITGTYAVAFGNSAFNRLYVATYTVNAANTWETKTVTITGDTSGTWLTDNGIGLRVYFDLGSGSAYNATSSGSWLGTGVGIRLSTTVNWISTSGATFYLSGVQLEKGSTATPFEFRSIGQELALCQRYFELIDAATGAVPTTGQADSTSTAIAPIAFRTTKRAVPTFTVTGTLIGVTAGGGIANGSLSLSQGNVNYARLALSGASGLVAGNSVAIYATSNSTMSFSSEL